MGGQQFSSDCPLLDMSDMNRAIALDEERGLLTMEAGAMWPDVVRAKRDRASGEQRHAIRQKQTGADTLTLGGAVACNAHGRGLMMGPVGEDVDILTLVDAGGEVVECSRDPDAELFSLVIGGYGLFGVVVHVTLRLCPRRKLQRLVDIIDIDDAVNAVCRRVADGCVDGDFQYAIDSRDDSFLHRGLMAPATARRRTARPSTMRPRTSRTIRAIRLDQTSLLPWAREGFACVIFNLRTPHTAAGIERTHKTFRKRTDASRDLGGWFYLTYHRAATAE